MFSAGQLKKRFKKKRYLFPAVLLTILIVGRIMLPSILLKKANNYLSEFAPHYYIHLTDLDLSIIPMYYRFEGVTGKLKDTNQEFLSVDKVEVSVAWREIFKGRILTDIDIFKLHFLLIKDLKKLTLPKKEASDVFFPVKIERIDLMDSTISFENYKSPKDEGHLKIFNINGRIYNINPSKKNPFTRFYLAANILDSQSKFQFTGMLNPAHKPPTWILDAEAKNILLTSLNPYLIKHLPLTFNKGILDFYSEVKSENHRMEGYVKPFFKDIDVVANQEKFLGIKHFGIEIVTALVNLILRQSDTKTLATVIDFDYDKELKIKTSKAVSKAIEHGFKQSLSPEIEHRYNIR